jgi:hypothetical protein
MRLITDLRDRLQDVHDNMYVYVEDIIRDVENNQNVVISNMNTQIQLYERGETREGVFIADYMPYSPFTVMMKGLKGQPTDRVTLRDEGDFYNSVYLEYQGDGFEIKASDWKTSKLVRDYGEEILGLNDENVNELTWDYLFPALLKKVSEQILNL